MDTLVSFPAPTIDADCGTIADGSYIFTVKRADGSVCVREEVASGATPTASRFAPGSFIVEYRLASDSTKTTGDLLFTVDVPNLICNDEVNTSLTPTCGLDLALDDLVESGCSEFPDSLVSFSVSVDGIPAKSVSFGPFTGSGSSKDAFVWIGKEELEAAGLPLTSGSINLTVSRTYTPRDSVPDGMGTGPLVCNNGPQTTSCNVVVNYEDNTAPVVLLEAVDTIVACDTTGLSEMLSASATDNCGGSLEAKLVSARFAADDPCFNNDSDDKPDTTSLVVVFQAVDGNNNTGSATRTIVVIRPTSIVMPDNVTAACDATASERGVPELEIGVLEDGELDVRGTVPLSTTDYICGYILLSENHPVVGTDCGKKEFIDWSVLDWCDPGSGASPIGRQLIEYVDTLAPVLEATDNTFAKVSNRDSLTGEFLELELDPWSCTYDASGVAAPDAWDNCDENPDVTLHSVVRVENILTGGLSGMRDSIDAGSLWPADVTELTCDTFRFMYIASDGCHEQPLQDTIYRFVVVLDKNIPSAICTDRLNVSIGNQSAKIFPSDVDANSYDACGIVSMGVRKKGSTGAFGELFEVTCEDIHEPVQVELQVTDKIGNTNICWADVEVEDKVNPLCGVLEDQAIKCTDQHAGVFGSDTDTNGDGNMDDDEWVDISDASDWNAQFGDPATVCSDNAGTCQSVTIEQQFQKISKHCGEVNLRRRYRAVDWDGQGNRSAWVEQKVTVEYVPGWTITLPKDLEVDCEIDGSNSLPSFSEKDIVIGSGFCDQLGVEVETREFTAQDGACKKLEVTYHIINWCNFEAGDTPTPIARPENANGKVVAGHEISAQSGATVDTVVTTDKEGNPDTTVITTPIFRTASYYTYTRVITLTDNVAPIVSIESVDLCVTGEDCTDQVEWVASVDDCASEEDMTFVWIITETGPDGTVNTIEGTGLLLVILPLEISTPMQ